MSKFNVLFLCTGNSCRSQMSEALMNDRFSDRFTAYSAGSKPDLEKFKDTRGVHPLAIQTLRSAQIPTENLHSKSWDDFIKRKEDIHFVFTLCDDARDEMAESCPVFPGQPMTAHWGVEDPARATGDEATVLRFFSRVFYVLETRIQLFGSLNMDSLSEFALQKELNDIGEKSD